jgi:hypothetical protein
MAILGYHVVRSRILITKCHPINVCYAHNTPYGLYAKQLLHARAPFAPTATSALPQFAHSTSGRSSSGRYRTTYSGQQKSNADDENAIFGYEHGALYCVFVPVQ